MSWLIVIENNKIFNVIYLYNMNWPLYISYIDQDESSSFTCFDIDFKWLKIDLNNELVYYR